MAVFRKHSPDAPARSIAWEAAGLRWLAEATSLGGMPVARVLDVGAAHLDLERLTPVAPTRDAAGTFGERLARTHDSGAGTAYGAGPPGWSADGWFGPADRPLPLSLARHDSWAPFYAQERLLPIAAACRDAGALSPEQAGLLDRVAARLPEHDPGEPPSRIHGDLWAGNVVWTDDGATLIDPSAHAGHRETDLAMLELFGLRGLDRVLAGYDEAAPLAAGRAGRVGLHQLHPLLVHAVLFGAGYGAQAEAIARRHA